MILASLGIIFSTMVGPLDGAPAVRISKPGGGPPEVVRQVAGEVASGGGVRVPVNAVAGGGAVTVIGAEDAAAKAAAAMALGDEPRVLYTEQLLRAFGYDRSNFGYTVVNGQGRGRGWRQRGEGSELEIDPRVEAMLRDAAPIESRFPPVPGR